jgi:hypothetical protein
VSRFELPTPRPPDAYSNLTELHPDEGMGVGVGVRCGGSESGMGDLGVQI